MRADRNTKNRMKKHLFLIVCALAALPLAAHNDKYVNMFLGSAGDNGQTTPGAAVPFGMISVCPDSRPGQHGGYDYDAAEISGVSINRISGVGCYGTGGNVSVRPARGCDTLRIVKGTEKASPGYYETMFDNGVRGRFTATHNVAVERYDFPQHGERLLEIDFSAAFDGRNVSQSFEVTGDRTVDGRITAPTACARGTYRLFVHLATDRPFEVVGRDSCRLTLRFDDRTRSVELRIAASPIDNATARAEAERIAGRPFDELRRAARDLWREKLDRIDIDCPDRDSRVLFYTSLYRCYLSPWDATSSDGRYRATDGRVYDAAGFRYYSSWSLWDTYRTKFPLLVILEPALMSDIAHSLVELFRTGKRNWATRRECVPTVRTEHAVILLLDAWRKGIADIDFRTAWEGMRSEAAHNLPTKSPDQKMETSCDLWALAQIARLLGHDEAAKEYAARSAAMFDEVWRKEFMTVTPDFARMGSNGMYQGTRWQYRWAAPQYLGRMVGTLGRERLLAELTEFFDRDLFNQGNEPDIHTPMLFNMLGAPHLTQRTVRKLLTDPNTVHLYGGNAEYPEPYVGPAFRNATDGYLPEMDEDDGAMSAWYLFCAMGFYPVVVGTDSYELFSPLYDRITIRHDFGTTTIRTSGRRHPDDTIRRIELDGRPLDGYSVSHDIFRKDSELVFCY